MLSKLIHSINFSNLDSKPVVVQEESSIADSCSSSPAEVVLFQDDHPASKPIDIKYYVPTSDALGLSQSLLCHTNPFYQEFGFDCEDDDEDAYAHSGLDIYSKSVPVDFCTFSEYIKKARVVCPLGLNDVEELSTPTDADATTFLVFGSLTEEELFVKHDVESLVVGYSSETESSIKDCAISTSLVFGTVVVDEPIVKRDVTSLIFDSTTDEELFLMNDTASLISGSTIEEESEGSIIQQERLSCDDFERIFEQKRSLGEPAEHFLANLDDDERADSAYGEDDNEPDCYFPIVEHYAVQNRQGAYHYFGPVEPVYITHMVPYHGSLPCLSIPATIPEVDEDFAEWTELADATFGETSLTPWDASFESESSVERIKKNPFIPLLMKQHLSPLKITQLPNTQYKEIQNHFCSPNVVYIRHLKYFRCAYIVYRNRDEMIKAYHDPYLHFVENKPVTLEFSTMEELEHDYNLDEQRRLACPSIVTNKKYDTYIPNYHYGSC